MHLWTGIVLGIYVLTMSVTGSILVYSGEIFTAATPEPILSKSGSPRLTDDQLADAARSKYPGFRVTKISRMRNPDQAVEIWLRDGGAIRQRLFDPRTGADLGNSVPPGIRFVSRMLDLHDNLFAGKTGRRINAAGGAALLVLAITGIAIWWPGHFRIPRTLWHLHGAVGFWSFAFLVIFGLSGLYLGNPDPWQDLVDKIEPPTFQNAGVRLGDQIVYWLAFLHFGRINGIGIPCKGPGVCDQATKAVWAIFGFAPAVMFVTGAMLWWKRVLRRRIKDGSATGRALPDTAGDTPPPART